MHQRTPSGSSRQRNGTVGAKQLANAIGMSVKSTRQMLRKKFGRHESWDLWLIPRAEADAIIEKYQRQNRPP